MGVVNKRPAKENINNKESKLWAGIFISGLIAGLILRLYLATTADTPGHGDPAFYYTVAKNIVDGRGLVVDYIVYFLNGLEPIPHYSGDFWNPLASILLSIPMLILGKSVFNAILASIVFGTIPPIIGYLAAQHFSKSTRFAALTGILVFFAPIQIRTSVATDSIIFYGALGAIALYFTILAFEKPYYLLLAAICTGLAQFTRQDGILLLVTIEVCALLLKLKWQKKIYLGVGVLIVHLLVLSPLMIRNYSELHALFPPGPSKTMFLTKYEDFHAYGLDLSWKSYRGSLGLLGIAKSKLNFAAQNLEALQSFLDPIVTALTIIGLVNIIVRRRKKSNLYCLIPVLIFALFQYLFYTLIASFSGPGSFPKCLAALTPFTYIVIVDLLIDYVKPGQLLLPIIFTLALYTGVSGFKQAYAFNTYYNEVYKEYSTVKGMILEDTTQKVPEGEDVIIMTRNPWDVYEATGFKAVMIPNNNLNTIYRIAEIYKAKYLLLPAPRPFLQAIYDGTEHDPRFKMVAAIPSTIQSEPDFKIFRIALPQSTK